MSRSDRLPTQHLSLGSKGTDVRKLYDYLERFGYFPNDDLSGFATWRPAVDATVDDKESFDATVDRAVRLFQEQNALKPDGLVGPRTLALMGRARCGVPDVVPKEGPQPFVASGSRWDRLTLTYQFDNLGADLAANDARGAVRAAFDRWSAVTPLVFQEVASGADIQIGWFSGDHGDGTANAFDGASGVLAHCFYPPPGGGSLAGDLHFDEAETWTTDDPPAGIDLLTVALHEIGHGLGLGHSADASSVMFAYYGGSRRELTADDVAGIQTIYGGWHQPFSVATPGDARPGAVATLSRFTDHADAYWVGADGSVRTTFWIPSEGWHQPFAIAPAGSAAPGAVATLSRFTDHADAYWIGADGSVQTNFWVPADGWHQPFAIAPAGSAAPGAVATLSRFTDHADAYWIGPDGSVRTNFWIPSEGWHQPFAIAPAGSAAPGAVATLSRFTDHADAYWIGPDGSVQTTFWTPSEGWHPPFAIAAAGSAAPGAVATLSRFRDHADVYWIGPDGSVRTTFWTPSEGWHPPFAIAAAGSAAPGAVATLSRFTDHADVYWIGPDGSVRTTFWIPSEGWHQPFAIAPPGDAAPGAVATLSRYTDHADAYWIGRDGSVRTTYWTRP